MASPSLQALQRPGEGESAESPWDGTSLVVPYVPLSWSNLCPHPPAHHQATHDKSIPSFSGAAGSPNTEAQSPAHSNSKQLAVIPAQVGLLSPALTSSAQFPVPSAQPGLLSPALTGSEQLAVTPARIGLVSPALTGSEQLPMAPPSTPTLSHPMPEPSTLPLLSSSFVLEDERIPEPSEQAYAAVLMDTNSWGSAWTGCIQAFIGVERENGFQLVDHRLPHSKLRPDQITAWMKKRAASGPVWDSLNSRDAEAFGETWWAWWVDMQPAGRINSTSLSRPTQGLDWKRLHKTGCSGLFFVMLTLV